VIEAFRPSQQTEDEVRNWLIDSGIPTQRITHTENKAWFAFFATAAEAESLLFTEFHEYEDSVTGGVIPSCDEYHLPKHIRQHIDYITPGIKLMAPVESHREKRAAAMAEHGIESRSVHLQQHGKAPAADPNDLSTCDQLITPACIAALYKIPPGTSKIRGNSLGIFESELQFYAQKDLDSFFTTYRKDIKNGTHPIGANIDGGMQSTKDLFQALAGGEVALDLQLAYPIVYPQEITLYDVDDFIVQSNQLDTYTFGFNTFLDALDGVSQNLKKFKELETDSSTVILQLLGIRRDWQPTRS
jgi:tripeptidyl-peptidase-1